MYSDFLPSYPSETCVCGGTREIRKCFKNEKEKVVDCVCSHCPVCHPNLAQPIFPNPEQVEVGYEEFNRLSRTEGWTVG